ncbi:MAG TPA: RidA family protein [Kiloniellaceae bacterium]|nr:RidA family protein [Kiloniellaceae bacterium]
MPDLETFHTDAVPAELPFSAALRAGDFVFTSGQIGNIAGEMKLVEGGIKAEGQQALEHLRAALEAAGSSLDRVVKCTVFFTDMNDFQPFNDVYREFFTSHLPARSGVEVKGLALGARVEIECIALAGRG